VGRRRFVRVFLSSDNTIALAVPPGEVAIFSPDEALELRAVLRQAAFIACDALPEDDSSHAAPQLNYLSSTIPCVDAIGRQRALTVASRSGEPVVLIAPAGGVAVLRPLQIGSLRGALRDVRAAALAPRTLARDATQPESLVREPERVVA
jgi:hypothetical protein